MPIFCGGGCDTVGGGALALGMMFKCGGGQVAN
jgi:hypothetical protein